MNEEIEVVELPIELNLPDHTKELEETDDYIKNLKQKLITYRADKTVQPMSKKQHKIMYEEIVRGLYYLGNLSGPAFAAEDKIEKEYFNTYKHAPELARKLWWDHYERIHRPYTLFKNRLFKMIEDLDELYFAIFKCPPPDYVK
jgi:hypothetical protein